jgi:hypothetical protein
MAESRKMPDGVVRSHGLVAEFRLLYRHPCSPDVYRILTAVGESYANNSDLHWCCDNHEK